MKKGIVILFSLLIVCSAFAFDKGSMLIGGQAGFSFSKDNSDDDGTTDLVFFPQLGYFVNPNICVDAILKFELMGSEDYDVTAFGLGLGGRYFFSQLYAGADLQWQNATVDMSQLGKSSVSAMYGTLKAGYLYPILPGAYIDAQARYMMGLGDYGGDMSGKNEQSGFSVLFGLQVELNR